MALTPERKAELWGKLEDIIGPMPTPKPKVVARDDVGEIRDADVYVSRADPNANGKAEVVAVRRPEWVTVNLVEYERQQAEKAWDRYYRRQRHPFGIWGNSIDDDE